MPPTYSPAERDRRWRLARELMDAEDVDALVVYGERESGGPAPFALDAYFTNDRPGTIVVFPRTAGPVVLVPSAAHVGDHMEARRRGEATWVEPRDMRVGRHAPGVAEVLREHGLHRAAVGVLGLEPYPLFHLNPIMPHLLWTSLVEMLPQVTFKPVWHGFMLRALRQSPEELAVLRYAAEAGEAMARAMAQAARPGVSEADVYAAAVAEALRRGVSAPGLSLSSGPGFVSSGPPAWSYRPQPPRVLAEGDVVLAETVCMYGMREAHQRVTLAVGEAHPDVDRAARAARAAYEAGLSALRPGATFGEVVTAMRRPLEEAGAWSLGPPVHGLNPYGAVAGSGTGLRTLPEAGPYGLAAPPTIGSDLPLAAGMVFALKPDCVVEGRPAGVGGTVIVGETAPVELNTVTTRMLRV
ncbi:M24 family metallopeptidase [Planomonospora alba]|uniref:M24 family metallopeptidase n=1 Tax=Planomonospora alba TaxID=161354 RepID=A0ABP6MLV1_9ACTN